MVRSAKMYWSHCCHELMHLINLDMHFNGTSHCSNLTYSTKSFVEPKIIAALCQYNRSILLPISSTTNDNRLNLLHAIFSIKHIAIHWLTFFQIKIDFLQNDKFLSFVQSCINVLLLINNFQEISYWHIIKIIDINLSIWITKLLLFHKQTQTHFMDNY